MIEKTKFDGIDAVKITNAKNDELIILTGVGPRIISFRPEGKNNIFYVNEADINTAAHDDTWRIYGGTRLWTSPETEVSYAPDNASCEVIIDSQSVTITAPPNTGTTLQKQICVEPKESYFSISYSIKNTGHHLVSAGIWALSCVKPIEGASIYLPWGDRKEWNIKEMKYWKSWLTAGSNIESPQWKPTNEFFIINPSGETGKVGFLNRWGFSIYMTAEATFVKRASYIESALYPDDGCSFEIYTSKDFFEIETLSPLYTMKPGLIYTHTEHWWGGTRTIPVDSIESAEESINDLLP